MIQAHLIHSKLHARLQWGQWLSRHVFKNGCVCHFQFKCLSQCCFWAKPSPHEIIRRFKGRVWVTFLTWAVSCCVMCAETFHSDTNFCFCLQSPVLPPLFPTYVSDAAATIHNLTWLPHTFSLLSYSLPGSKVTSHFTWYYNQNIGACLTSMRLQMTINYWRSADPRQWSQTPSQHQSHSFNFTAHNSFFPPRLSWKATFFSFKP